MAAFARAYAILGAQRSTKILGIFARLEKARRQAAISRASSSHRALSAQEPRTPRAGRPARLVRRTSAGTGRMPERPDIAMVFAAGLGTRMRPVTDTLPKPLVLVGRRTLLDHMLERFAEAGVSRAIVNVHYRADQIEAHLRGTKDARCHDLRRTRKIARSGRRHPESPAADRRRAVLYRQHRRDLDGTNMRLSSRRSPTPGTPPAATSCCSLRDEKEPSASTGPATFIDETTDNSFAAPATKKPTTSMPASAS